MVGNCNSDDGRLWRDVIPVTAEGKAVAVFLMLIGIPLLGVLAAGIAAYFVESSVRDEERSEGASLEQRLDRLEANIKEQK